MNYLSPWQGELFIKNTFGAFLFILLIQSVGIADHSLWTPDEPREAQIVREMSLSGDYLIPRFSGHAFLEKPPLYYSLAVASYAMFGSSFHEAGRIASAVFALATLLTVYYTARRMKPGHDAVMAALVLATFPIFFIASHKILVDIGLVFFITAAMCAFLRAYQEKSRQWYKVFWLCLVLAFLTKGIVGIAIPGVGIIIFMAWQRDWGIIRQAWTIRGMIVVLASMAAWGGMLYLKGGHEYLYEFYVYNQIGRFIPTNAIYEGGHVRPFYYYLMQVPVQTLPWSLVLIPALATERKPGETDRFLYSWLLGGLLILSIASTKREIYFLPMYPAMALIIFRWMAREEFRKWEDALLISLLWLAALLSVAVPVGYVVKLGGDWRIAILLSSALAAVFLFMKHRCGQSRPLLATLSFTLIFVLWTPALFPRIDQEKSYKGLFESMGRIVSHRQVIGYQLTETIEAFGPFYGGFPVENIEDRQSFANALANRGAPYVITLPSRIDENLRKGLESRASLVYEGGGGTRREIELWKMHSSP